MTAYRRAPGQPVLLCSLLLCLALLGGCGKKGDLRPPSGEHEAFTWPLQYPAPSTVVPAAPAEAEPEVDPITGQPRPTSGFRQPDGLPRRDPDRTTTTIYSAE